MSLGACENLGHHFEEHRSLAIDDTSVVNGGGSGGSMSLQATPAAAGKPSALLRERDPNQLASVQKSAGKRKMVCFEIKVGAEGAEGTATRR